MEEVSVVARLIRAVTAILVLPLLLVAACTSAALTGRAAAPVTMANCGGGLHAQPSLVQVICYSDAITARSLAWSDWGRPVATAVGVAVVDVCAYDDCHTGSFTSIPIVIIASKIVACPKRAHAYSRLQYVFVGRSPFSGLPADMNFSNFLFGTGRVGPARDQTVTLGC
jgi:hypothetical protein